MTAAKWIGIAVSGWTAVNIAGLLAWAAVIEVRDRILARRRRQAHAQMDVEYRRLCKEHDR